METEGTETNTTPQAAAPPAAAASSQAASPTQSTAVNVDIEAIARVAAEKGGQKEEAVFKSMLLQDGLDMELVKAMTAEWKAKQTTPEQILKEKDDAIAALQAEKLAEQQKTIALMKGIPLADETQTDKVNAVLTLAKSYVSDTVTYEAALDNALKIINFGEQQQSGFVPTAGQSGGGTAQKTTKEEMLAAAQKAMGIIVK